MTYRTKQCDCEDKSTCQSCPNRASPVDNGTISQRSITNTDQQIVHRKIESLTPPQVRQWLSERLANCYRIAATKRGLDRDGWLEDAAYFAAAMGMVEWTELERLDMASAHSTADQS